MKKITKNLTAIIMAILVISTVFATTLVAYAATDENHDYSFSIQASQAVSKYSNGNLRSTYNNNNAWKVNLKKSGEGSGTATNFRLCLKDNSGASSWHTVVQGTGAHYYSATDAADNTTVYLQGKNNNNNTSTYTVTGYWDEETGITPD